MTSAETSSSGRARVLDGTSPRLFARARDGDSSAAAQLIVRYLPELRRWAHGRLPAFDVRGRRALAAYLREAVRNRIADEHRRIARRGVARPLFDTLASGEPSPCDRAVATEAESRYHAALARLSPPDRELIVAHVEMDYTHEQLGCMIGRSPNAARMALRRAVGRLADEMRRG